ncbi:hypothetical protein [Rhodoferax sp.]|uniref:hypothetical protein n=1 Tax=Rhodoferax sp. TaxID=50421 RepID=UPI003783E690
MKIEQKRLSNVHTFEFKEKFLNFAYRDKSGSGDIDVAYVNLPLKTSTKIEDNSWWRNVGYIWCGIGVFDIGTAIAAGGSAAGRGFWLVLGLACLAIYRFTRVKYTVLGFDGGNVWVIQDGKTHDRVLKELMERRKSQLRALYGEIDLESNFDSEKRKFEYLKEQGVLSEAETEEKIRQAAATFSVGAESLRILN